MDRGLLYELFTIDVNNDNFVNLWYTLLYKKPFPSDLTESPFLIIFPIFISLFYVYILEAKKGVSTCSKVNNFFPCPG